MLAQAAQRERDMLAHEKEEKLKRKNMLGNNESNVECSDEEIKKHTELP